MHALLVAMPASVVEELERALRETEAGRACHALCVDAPPDTVPDGLVVLWDGGGPLEALLDRCRHLHARRSPAHTHLVVLTSRGPAEAETLALAGADECVAPPGSHWGARLVALRRRMEAVGTEDVAFPRGACDCQLRLAERMASVGTLASGVAHEINNPLAYVTSNLSYLWERVAQSELPPEQLPELRQVVAEALEGAGRVRSIVRDLRTFSRVDEEGHGPLDVHACIEGALRLVRDELQHRARLVCSLEPVPGVHGNEGRLVQVFINLLANALQSFPERPAEENRIRVSARRSRGGHVLVEVQDNGRGMTPDVRARIFEPFFTTRPRGAGTGLGLSICLTTVQAMGGRIDVSSAQGAGSTFRVVLPSLATQHVSAPAGPHAHGPGDEARTDRRRLLLIDDEPAVGNAVSRLLRDLYDVHVFQDAREALHSLSHGERFDAILCDLMMPGMSGMDFLVELERLAPELTSHTGLMTGGAFTSQAREFVGRRARELLEKPFERERLCTFVEHLMQ